MAKAEKKVSNFKVLNQIISVHIITCLFFVQADNM
jgi:hypothetical protein